MSENEVVAVEQLPVVQQATPMTLIQMAVQQGGKVSELKELFDLQLRWEQNEARKAFVTALNLFKADPPIIYKNTAVDFTSSKGRTHYKHATLDNVSGLIGAALAKVGISHRWDTQQLENGLVKVTCILTHSMGHTESVWLQAPKDESGNKNSIQAVVSTVTYLERQTLLSATGMAVSNTDDDGRQGVKGMPEEAKADWLAAIEAHTDPETASALWQKVADACTKAGDIPAYDALKSAMLAKVKALKQQPKEAI